MNRRNVLGNKIEESKTMWVVLIGLFASALTCVEYHMAGEGWLGMLLAGVTLLLGGIVVHFVTGEQGELFAYLLLPCVLFGTAGILIPHLSGAILPDSRTMLLTCLFSWLIPVVYAIIYTWIEGFAVMAEFAAFYKRAVIFFYVVYFGLMVYDVALRPYVQLSEPSVQLIPFATFAALINGMIQKTAGIGQLTEFLLTRIVFFLPYGFFIAMVCRKLAVLLRVVLLLVLPVLVELIQFITGRSSCDADDVVFCFFGGLIGMLCFLVFNRLFQTIVGRNFDGSEVERDYYGRKL